MRIGKKILTMTMIPIFYGACVTTILIVFINTTQEHYKADFVYAKISQESGELLILTHDVALHPSESRPRTQWQDKFKSLESLITGLKSTEDAGREVLDGMKSSLGKLESIGQSLFALSLKEELAGGNLKSLFSVKQAIYNARLGRESRTIAANAGVLMQLENNYLIRRQWIVGWIIITVFIILAVVLWWYSYFVRKSIVSPLSIMMDHTRLIAEGDLSQHVPVNSDDELGQLSQSFNHMEAELSRSIHDLEVNREDLIKARELAEGQRRVAENANKAKSIFLANMSHEIRTPMNAILGFTQILKRFETCPNKQSYIENIEASGKALLELINDILDLSKVEAGKLDITKNPFAVRHLFDELEMVFEHKVREKELYYIADVDSSVPEFLNLDEFRLRQVLVNLVGNAVKFTHAGGIKVEVSFEPGSSPASGDLILSVGDTGVGIDCADLPHVFDTFFQTARKEQLNYGGTGLGLAITQRLVNMMDGTIRVESNLGEGACFTVTLADVEVAADCADNVVCSLDQFCVCFEPATILIADDVESNRNVIINHLHEYCFKYIEAENGREVLELAQREQPALILLDMKMPVMDGCTAYKLLQLDPELRSIPVISVTAAAMKQDMLDNPCDVVLTKPIDRVGLLSALCRYLPHTQMRKDSLQEIQKQVDDLSRDDITCIGADLYNELSAAANVGNVSKFSSLLDDQSELPPDLSAQLRSMVNNFQLEQLRKLFRNS